MLSAYEFNEKERKQLLESIHILVDTREKENSHILSYFDEKHIPYRKIKLKTGDYSFCIPKSEPLGITRDLNFSKHIVVERKANLDEIAGNLSTDRARLEKEFSQMPKECTLLIERASYESMIQGQYRSGYNPDALTASLETFKHRYHIDYYMIENMHYTGSFIHKRFYYYLREMIR